MTFFFFFFLRVQGRRPPQGAPPVDVATQTDVRPLPPGVGTQTPTFQEVFLDFVGLSTKKNGKYEI